MMNINVILHTRETAFTGHGKRPETANPCFSLDTFTTVIPAVGCSLGPVAFQRDAPLPPHKKHLRC